MIGSYTLSRTETNYEKEQWYREILENGRKTTYSISIGTIFQEMTIYDNVQKYFYMGREILDYSGKNLGVMLIRLSEKNLGKTGSKYGDRGRRCPLYSEQKQ